LMPSRVPCPLARCIGLILLFFSASSLVCAQIPAPRTLRTVHDIFNLSSEQASRALPIDLQAVVLYSDPDWGILFVLDRTGPSFIDVHGIGAKFPIGTRVRVNAVTGTNKDGPIVAHPRIVVLGRGPEPKPGKKTVADLQDGTDESFLVTTEGILRPCERDYFRVCFRIYDGKKSAWLSVPQPFSQAAQGLVGSIVRVRGVVGRHVDDAGKRLGGELYVNSLDDIQVEETPATSDFSSPPLHIGDLQASSADQRFVRTVHLRGVVTWQSPGLFSIQDGSGTVFVGTRNDVIIHTGSTVDAIGFPSHGQFGLELSDSTVHLAAIQSSAAPVVPLRLTAAEGVKRSLNGTRVRLNARLVSQSSNETEFIYKLESGELRFNAVLLRNEAARDTVNLAPGSTLELTGMAVVQGGSPEWPASLLVLIESPADLAVKGGFAWLTAGSALALLAGIATCLIVPLVWVTALRRTVRSQTAIIRARLESELQLETRYRRLFERNMAAVFTWRADGTIIDCNMAFVRMIGLQSREQLLGRSYWDFEVDPVLRERLQHSLPEEAMGNRDASLRRDDNAIIHLLKNITPVETPEGVVYETTAIDVTQLRHNQAELQRARDTAVYESLNDPLTGLPNRRYLMEKLSSMLVIATRDNEMVGLLFLDLDGFKLVNDSLGHSVGDALLVQVARRLRSRMRTGDMLARLGGDEFVATIEKMSCEEDATAMAVDLLDAFSRPFQLMGHSLSIGVSMGISHFPGSSTNAEELMQQADSAMYAAKREGKNRVMHYTPEIGFQIHERMTLENMLRGAVSRHEISVHYQPEFDLSDQRLIRFEALARWKHPTLGMIPPDKFIPIAEESGIIDALGMTIMEMACTEAVTWQSLTGEPIQIAVNVSNIQFRQKGFIQELNSILTRTGLHPELLQIEVTESVMMGANDQTKETMNYLRAMGITMAIDDFGTGYSNLSSLPSLAFDALKVDRSFMLNLESQPETESMIRTLITLAQNLGMRVIIEGVETEEQLALIKSLGADEVQGYLTGRPTPNPQELIPLAKAS